VITSKKRGVGKLLALTLLGALATSFFVAVGPVNSAEAHTGDIAATAVCNTETGQYDVTYKLTLRNAPQGQTASTSWKVGTQNFQGTPTSAAGMDRGLIVSAGNGEVTLGSHSLPGSTKGNGPWIYAYTKWSGGYGYGSDTRVEGLKGNCEKPFDWNWQYAAPTCDGLTVNYPANLPAGQANDVNVRLKNLDTGEVRTFNFHNNSGTWSGTKTFDVKSLSNWPGWQHFEWQWTQVAGTNYHWEGSVVCGTPRPEKPEPVVTQTPKESVDCVAVIVNITTTITTTDWEWNDSKGKWVLGEPAVIAEHSTRALTDSERTTCAGDKPKPIVEEKIDEKVVCTTELVTITKTTSTSTPVLEGVEWVFGEPEVVVTTSSRPATLEELNKADCPPSTDPPAPKVDTKVTPRIDCAAETVTEVTVTTTIDPVWNAETRTWVDGEPVVKTSTSDRNATASEKSACPSPPSKEKPPVKPAANKTDLAVTGGPSVLPLVGGSAALILIGGALLTTLTIRRRRQKVDA
jgi:hypothetical protein